MDKAITIKAASGATPVVDAGARSPAFLVRAAATADGFTVRNSGTSSTQNTKGIYWVSYRVRDICPV